MAYGLKACSCHPLKLGTTINIRILNTAMSANATEKTLDSPREQGDNKSGKSRAYKTKYYGKKKKK